MLEEIEEERRRNRSAVAWSLVLTLGASWSLWSLLWIFDVSLPSPAHVTAASFLRFARFAAPGTLVPGISALVVTRLVLHESWRTTTLNVVGRKRFYLRAEYCPHFAYYKLLPRSQDAARHACHGSRHH